MNPSGPSKRSWTSTKNMIGQRFGKVKVLELVKLKPGLTHCLCLCDCGNRFIAWANNVRNGHTKSCGCLVVEKQLESHFIHGKSKSRAHKIWRHLKERCENKNSKSYPRYGGRGIKICPKWNNFEKFYADMGDPPPGMSIDRIDNNGNYGPLNCRWANAKTQANNRRSNLIFTVNGITGNLTQLCSIFEKKYTKVLQRLYRGWDINKALSI